MTNHKIRYKPIKEEILAIADAHGNNPEATLEVLRDIQNERGGLSQEDLRDAARALKIPAHKTYGVASFYSLLSLEKEEKEEENVLRICDSPACWLHHASETRQALEGTLPKNWRIERSSCLGLCDQAPALLVNGEQVGPVLPEHAHDVYKGYRGTSKNYSEAQEGELRVMMALAGKIDPNSIEDALAHGVYEGFQKALQMQPKEILAEINKSGLQGRGGASFPTGIKWNFAFDAKSTTKYLICNADESEPLMFKDRVLMDTNPHQILAGMAIGGYTIGANEAWIYIRGEYESQARRLENAIAEAEKKGWLGKNIQNSGFDFKIHVHRGAGAYICGEETALIESLEGKRGEPRARPPFPPQVGFRGKPTVVNNVETFAAASHILKHGAEWHLSLSDSPIPGTRLYTVLGHVKNPGLFEAPFCLSLREIIDLAGGMLPKSELKCALAGGASGNFVPASMLDVSGAFTFTSEYPCGESGPSAFMICDQSVSVVALLQQIMGFFVSESCGKCTPCRVGTTQAFNLLTRMVNGQGRKGDVEKLSELAEYMRMSSFCGLGQSTANPTISAIVRFPGEFSAAEH